MIWGWLNLIAAIAHITAGYFFDAHLSLVVGGLNLGISWVVFSALSEAKQ